MTANSQPNLFEFSEADTCREYVTPAIQAAGWGDCPFEIAKQCSFTDGRIVLTGCTARRHKYIRSNFLRPHLHYRPNRQRRDLSNSDEHMSLILAGTVDMLAPESSL